MSHAAVNTLDEAFRRSTLSSSNQMEMLTFRLTDNQLYGINVFKIIQVLECPKQITKLPGAHPAIKGTLLFREHGVNVIDLAQAIGMDAVDYRHTLSYLVVCEYNNQLTAFLIQSPETLLTRGWDQINKPEGFNAPCVVAIAYADNEEMILILDIETILSEVVGANSDFSLRIDQKVAATLANKSVLLVDDSKSAMMLMKEAMTQLGIKHVEFDSAVKALHYLEEVEPKATFDLIISDIEMPGMDGFTFTRRLRTLPLGKQVPVVLHSSMSNPTNRLKAEEAGANQFLPKFNPEELSELVIRLIG